MKKTDGQRIRIANEFCMELMEQFPKLKISIWDKEISDTKTLVRIYLRSTTGVDLGFISVSDHGKLFIEDVSPELKAPVGRFIKTYELEATM